MKKDENCTSKTTLDNMVCMEVAKQATEDIAQKEAIIQTKNEVIETIKEESKLKNKSFDEAMRGSKDTTDKSLKGMTVTIVSVVALVAIVAIALTIIHLNGASAIC